MGKTARFQILNVPASKIALIQIFNSFAGQNLAVLKRISYLGIFSMSYVIYEFINWILADKMILALKALF